MKDDNFIIRKNKNKMSWKITIKKNKFVCILECKDPKKYISSYDKICKNKYNFFINLN